MKKVIVLAIVLGLSAAAGAKGFDGGNAPGGGQVGGKWYNPSQGGGTAACCMDAEVAAIGLGLESDDTDTRNLAGQALKRNLQDQVDK